jgi:hypothetical protein
MGSAGLTYEHLCDQHRGVTLLPRRFRNHRRTATYSGGWLPTLGRPMKRTARWKNGLPGTDTPSMTLRPHAFSIGILVRRRP